MAMYQQRQRLMPNIWHLSHRKHDYKCCHKLLRVIFEFKYSFQVLCFCGFAEISFNQYFIQKVILILSHLLKRLKKTTIIYI